MRRFRQLKMSQNRSRKVPDKPAQTQREKFEQAARELETDDDPQRFRERVGKLVKHKRVEKPE
jgi:hypothetical protein